MLVYVAIKRSWLIFPCHFSPLFIYPFMLANIPSLSQILSMRMPSSHFHKITRQSDRWIVKANIIDCDVHLYIDHLVSIGVSLLLLLHQALKPYCIKSLAPLATTFFHLTQFWMRFVQLFIVVFLKYRFMSFFPLINGLPANPVHISFQSQSFLPPYHLPFLVHDQTSSTCGPYCN